MRYAEIITRSWAVFWRHPYLWLLGALGGGELITAGGFPRTSFNGRRPDGLAGLGASGAGAQVVSWFTANAPLLIGLAALLALFFLAYFLISALTTPALVRAAAEHDAERPFRLADAWRAGSERFFAVLGLNLLFGLYGLVVLVLYGGLGLAGLTAAAAHRPGAVAGAIVAGVLLAPVAFLLGLVLQVVRLLAARAVALELLGPIAAIRRGFSLVAHRPGRVAATWLIQVALSLGAGIALGVVLGILALPFVGAALVGYGAGGLGATLTASAVGLTVFIVASTLVSGAVGAYFSAYWTLAFRRLELDSPQPTAPQPFAPAPSA
jgi:hypothetical protein